VVVDTSRRPVSHVVDDVVAWLAAATAAAAPGSPDLPHHRQEDDA
jgi:shikimate kinase